MRKSKPKLFVERSPNQERTYTRIVTLRDLLTKLDICNLVRKHDTSGDRGDISRWSREGEVMYLINLLADAFPIQIWWQDILYVLPTASKASHLVRHKIIVHPNNSLHTCLCLNNMRPCPLNAGNSVHRSPVAHLGPYSIFHKCGLRKYRVWQMSWPSTVIKFLLRLLATKWSLQKTSYPISLHSSKESLQYFVGTTNVVDHEKGWQQFRRQQLKVLTS